jgi:hypothetical protein
LNCARFSTGSPRRIEAHVKLCVLALQMQPVAEIRCIKPWSIAQELAALKAIRSRSRAERTKIPESRKVSPRS